ncbi:hypothetical protein [Leptolyngbya sp. KIOST-1]|uniref:hypothetical protein n=1 Tax=Leptolyngbya sp. KIOST-1 TaxID=1229172 RepID=UPI0012E0C137|nr:hypothetical protein [Leptolyngbya sp. KIOST-1]
MEETFTLAWALPECGTDFSVSRNGEKSGQGLGGLSQKIDGLHQILKVLHDNTRCEPPPPIATVPEWWQVRVGADRPQLVVLYAEIKKDGSLGQSRWPLTIPWFNASLRSELKRRLPSYNKGQWQGMLTLNDNSKILVHARTKTEAESTINTLARIIVSEQRPKPIAIVTGERQGTALKKVSVVPTVAHFYPTGQKNMKPAWTEKIR